MCISFKSHAKLTIHLFFSIFCLGIRAIKGLHSSCRIQTKANNEHANISVTFIFLVQAYLCKGEREKEHTQWFLFLLLVYNWTKTLGPPLSQPLNDRNHKAKILCYWLRWRSHRKTYTLTIIRWMNLIYFFWNDQDSKEVNMFLLWNN